MDPDSLVNALEVLGQVLEERGQTYSVLVAGGSGLLLLGYVSRPTADVDVVALAAPQGYLPAAPLPTELAEAARDVGRALGLQDDWLNSGPASLLDFGLPDGIAERVTVQQHGALVLHLAGRVDQIFFKLYAAVDQGPRSKHYADLIALSPTREELVAAARWTRTHDDSEGFLGELHDALRSLGVEVPRADL